jgi:ABC-type multidrug transport system fused ATPase/permease subunit
MAALGRLKQGRTVLMITHRPDTLDGCDMVLRVEDGRIVEERSAVLNRAA